MCLPQYVSSSEGERGGAKSQNLYCKANEWLPRVGGSVGALEFFFKSQK